MCFVLAKAFPVHLFMYEYSMLVRSHTSPIRGQDLFANESTVSLLIVHNAFGNKLLRKKVLTYFQDFFLSFEPKYNFNGQVSEHNHY